MQLLSFALLFFHLQLFAIGPDSAGPKKGQPLAIKDCMLTAESLISSGKISSSKWLTQKQVEELSINKIDDAYNADNLYHVFDTLYMSETGKVLLFGREHEEENKAWLATYTADNHLVDSAVIYYDNSEGFLLTETIIKNGVISIVTLNDYEVDAARKKVEQYKMNRHLHLEKLPVQKNIDSVKIDN